MRIKTARVSVDNGIDNLIFGNAFIACIYAYTGVMCSPKIVEQKDIIYFVMHDKADLPKVIKLIKKLFHLSSITAINEEIETDFTKDNCGFVIKFTKASRAKCETLLKMLGF